MPLDRLLYLFVAMAGSFMLGYQIYAWRCRKKYSVFRHIKTGGLYVVLYTGKFESTNTPCVIYTRLDTLSDPEPWARDYDEFHDGRFTYVATITR